MTPGWYPDPWRKGQQLWWDGHQWAPPPPGGRPTASTTTGIGKLIGVVVACALVVLTITIVVMAQMSKSTKPAAAPTTAATSTSAPTTAAATTTTKPPSEYPKEVPVSSIKDSRIRSYFEDENYTVGVQLAPGIWANRGAGPLGTVDDYGGVVGLCADFHQFEKTHSVGGSCW